MTSQAELIERLRPWILGAIETLNAERHAAPETEMYLVETLFRNVNGAGYLEVFIDTDRGVTVEECARLSRKLTDDIDAKPELQDLLPSDLRLEVSSPGLSRPLKLARQYRKNVGRLLRVKYRDSENAPRTVTGRLTRVSDGEPLELTLELSAAKKGKKKREEFLTLSIEQLAEATVEAEF